MREAEMVESVMERMRAYINLSGSDSDAKILSREVDRLRAVLANEVKHHVAKIEELARWKSWRPSDPGTKEAMKIAWRDATSTVLADALRAAMVRLEEAEKDRDEWVKLAGEGL